MSKGQLFLVPIQISDGQLNTIPQKTIDAIYSLNHFIVERARTSRRFISQTKPPYKIQDLEIIEIDRDDKYLSEGLSLLKQGHNVGLMSESGSPAIADPGFKFVSLAQKNNIEVIPLIGPNSILLALAASGLNGQQFTFHGYLPIKEPELVKKLKTIQTDVLKSNYTHAFIETPYRNNRIFKILIDNLNKELKLSIARDITGTNELIKTKTIGEWKKTGIEIGKFPTVFSIGK